MVIYTDKIKKYLSKTVPTLLGTVIWGETFSMGDEVLVSGNYRCEGCGHEITSNKDDPFPPQNKHQHAGSRVKVSWKLIVQTQTA